MDKICYFAHAKDLLSKLVLTVFNGNREKEKNIVQLMFVHGQHLNMTKSSAQ